MRRLLGVHVGRYRRDGGGPKRQEPILGLTSTDFTTDLASIITPFREQCTRMGVVSAIYAILSTFCLANFDSGHEHAPAFIECMRLAMDDWHRLIGLNRPENQMSAVRKPEDTAEFPLFYFTR
jgi:hypothetical protein